VVVCSDEVGSRASKGLRVRVWVFRGGGGLEGLKGGGGRRW
jgi:hypothetical protein